MKCGIFLCLWCRKVVSPRVLPVCLQFTTATVRLYGLQLEGKSFGIVLNFWILYVEVLHLLSACPYSLTFIIEEALRVPTHSCNLKMSNTFVLRNIVIN